MLLSTGVQHALAGGLIPFRTRPQEDVEAAPAPPLDGKPPCETCDNGFDVKGDICADCGRAWEPPF